MTKKSVLLIPSFQLSLVIPSLVTPPFVTPDLSFITPTISLHSYSCHLLSLVIRFLREPYSLPFVIPFLHVRYSFSLSLFPFFMCVIPFPFRYSLSSCALFLFPFVIPFLHVRYSFSLSLFLPSSVIPAFSSVIPAKAGIQNTSLFHNFLSFFYEEIRKNKNIMFFIFYV